MKEVSIDFDSTLVTINKDGKEIKQFYYPFLTFSKRSLFDPKALAFNIKNEQDDIIMAWTGEELEK